MKAVRTSDAVYTCLVTKAIILNGPIQRGTKAVAIVRLCRALEVVSLMQFL